MSLNPCDRKLFDWNVNQKCAIIYMSCKYIYIYLYVKYTSDAIGWKIDNITYIYVYNTKYVWIIMNMYVASD